MSSPRRTAVRAVLLCALTGCGADGDISIGAERSDAAAGTDRTAPDVTADVATPPPDVAPSPDVPLGPRPCMTSAECVGACPPGVRGCVCTLTMTMGLRCVPTCMVTPECPPGPMGMMLLCRAGLCAP